MKIVVSGAGGFIGSHLGPYLKSRGNEPVPLPRSDVRKPHKWLEGAEVLIHLLGIAHSGGVSAQAYQEINCELSVSLAAAARECGVRRFVFVSSSHAESHPESLYGASKAEAERRLLTLGTPEIVIVRPTLVYGPNAKGNFRALLRLASSTLPLPFEGASGRRSMVYIGNLVDALLFAAKQPNISGKIFTVTDPGRPKTLAEIVGALRAGAGRSGMMFPAPWLPGLLRGMGATNIAEKLFAEAVFDPTPLFEAGWTPPFTTDEALRLTALKNATRSMLSS